jgi:WXXGXW repeat (2 copies)
MNRSIVRWALFSILLLAFSAASYADAEVAVGISVRIGPPPLPVYAQPICPGPGYIWTPGYWAWNDDDGYYWVPGTWVVAPVGMLWTPGWWGWGGGFYAWHPGYWGPHVGYYGGINYGFGYTGVGFYGGEWRGERFYYNRSVTNVSVTNVRNVYNRTIIVNENHVSYNGGRGGVNMRPTPQQQAFARERHTPELAMQRDHEQAAMRNRENFARENHGRPAVAATARPGDFSRRAVVPARAAGGEYHAPAMSPRQARVVSNVPGNRGNPNAGGRNEGFRPFNPPSRSGNAANDRGGNNNARFNDNPPAPNRMNNNRPMPNRGNDNRVGNERPNDNRPAPNRMNENRPMPNHGNDNRVGNDRPNENRPMPNRPPDNRMNQPHPQNPPREMSRPQPNGPRENPRPAPAPHQSAPPKAEHHGR